MNDWYFLVLLAILGYFEGALRRESIVQDREVAEVDYANRMSVAKLIGSRPYDGCSLASSGTKTTSVAVSICNCKMNQVAEVRRAVLTLYSMNKSGNFKCNTLANRQPVEFL